MDAPPPDIDLPPVPPPPPPQAPESFVVVVDAVERIAFHDWGGPAALGPPVLLIHGLSGTARAWAPVARRLSSIRRVGALDPPGPRGSGAPPPRPAPAPPPP